METKICKKRNHTYDASLPRCPECRLINMHNWRVENKEYAQEKAREYAVIHKERKNAYNLAYREKNLEYLKAKDRQYRLDNLEKKNAYNKQWVVDNAEKVTEYRKKYNTEHSEQLEEYKRKWKSLNPRRERGNKLRKYWKNCTWEQALQNYDDLLVKQNGKCAICKQSETAIDAISGKTKDLAVDHCHATDKVRGLLCINCNHGLGKFKDDISRFQTAIDYLNAVRAEKETT